MAERAAANRGLQIGRMTLRVPGGSGQDGASLASHLQASLASTGLGSARDLPRVQLRVTVGRDAGPQLVAQAITRALRRRLA